MDALQIFDTWISHLDWAACQQCSAAYVEKIVSALRQHGIQLPITFFGKQTSVFYPMYASTGVNVISIDWNGHMGRIDNDLIPSITSNLDPFTLYGPEQALRTPLPHLHSFNPMTFIFNLGHANADIPVDAVQTYYRAFAN